MFKRRKKFKRFAGLPTRREVAKQGVLDGRENIPGENWGGERPPFLLDLRNQARVVLENIELNLLKQQDNSDSKTTNLETKLITAQKALELSEISLEETEKDFVNALSIDRPGEDELGESRSAKLRTYSTSMYVALLATLGLGEFAVTKAAFGYLFNEGNVTYGMTIATVAVSIGFAHQTGVAWKRSHDKENHPSDSVFRFWKIMFGLMILFVLGLAAARAAKTPIVIDGVQTKVPLADIFGEAPLYVFIFFILQITLILVALGAAYNHYSLPLERLHLIEKRARKRHKIQVKTLNLVRKLENDIELTKKQRPRLRIAARNEVRALIHTYSSLAEVYRASNLRGRSRTVSQAIVGLQAPELELPKWYLDEQLENPWYETPIEYKPTSQG
jgi:hypothetical protein